MKRGPALFFGRVDEVGRPGFQHLTGECAGQVYFKGHFMVSLREAINKIP